MEGRPDRFPRVPPFAPWRPPINLLSVSNDCPAALRRPRPLRQLPRAGESQRLARQARRTKAGGRGALGAWRGQTGRGACGLLLVTPRLGEFALKLDRVDALILDALQREGRLTNTALAERVGLSPSACLTRVRRLEHGGAIVGYRAVIDAGAIGLPFEMWGEINLAKHAPSIVARFAEVVQRTPAIIDVYELAGRQDFLVHLVSQSRQAWDQLIASLTKEGVPVASAQVSFVKGMVKRDQAIGSAQLRAAATPRDPDWHSISRR